MDVTNIARIDIGVDTTPELRLWLDQILDQARDDEATVRALLSRWVSEIEPAVVFQDGKIIGLTIAGAPVGSSPFILRLS